MDEKLVTQLRLLKQYIDVLFRVKLESKEQYMKDEILRGAAERYLQLSIETCINIGNRILSLEQFNYNIKAPETYADIFESLSIIGILDKDFSENLKEMARFRNKLVHIYWDMDNELIFRLLQTELDDFVRFMSIVSRYINRKEDSK